MKLGSLNPYRLMNWNAFLRVKVIEMAKWGSKRRKPRNRKVIRTKHEHKVVRENRLQKSESEQAETLDELDREIKSATEVWCLKGQW